MEKWENTTDGATRGSACFSPLTLKGAGVIGPDGNTNT